MFGFGWSMIALEADLFIGGGRELSSGGGLEWTLGIGTEFGQVTVGGDREAELDGFVGHGFATRDDHQLAVDEFLDEFEDGLAVAVPRDTGLFELLGGNGQIADGDLDLAGAVVAVRCGQQEGITHGISGAGFDADFESAIAKTPGIGVLAQPTPGRIQSFRKRIAKQESGGLGLGGLG